nr:MAG TPA: hypothetical protein [Caudoviricetes sp.]
MGILRGGYPSCNRELSVLLRQCNRAYRVRERAGSVL